MDIYEVDFREIVQLNTKILSGLGIFPCNFKSTKEYLIHFVRVTILTGFLFGTIIVSQFVNVVLSFQGGILEVVTVSYIALTSVFTAVKVLLVFINRRRILALITTVNREELRPRNIHQQNILKGYVKASKGLTIILIVSSSLVCCFLSAYPLISDSGPFLPLYAYIPYKTDDEVVFVITYIVESFGIVISAWCCITVDTLMTGLIMVICAQLSMLNDSLRNLHKYSANELRVTCYNEDIPEFLENAMLRNLTKCVRQHQCISQFKDELESIFTGTMSGQFMLSIFVLCAALYKLNSIEKSILEYLSTVLYIFTLLSEVFILCYFGHEVIAKHNELNNSVYHCNWIKCNKVPSFRKNLIFFMTRSQKPFRLLAGGYVILSFETFVAIIKSSFSYFTVLNQIDL